MWAEPVPHEGEGHAVIGVAQGDGEGVACVPGLAASVRRLGDSRDDEADCVGAVGNAKAGWHKSLD